MKTISSSGQKLVCEKKDRENWPEKYLRDRINGTS